MAIGRERIQGGLPESIVKAVRSSPGRGVEVRENAETGGYFLNTQTMAVRKANLPTPRKVTAFGGSDTGLFGGGDARFMEPQIRNPLLSPSNFQLPQTSLELNQWLRYFDRFHPTVGNAVDMHSSVPFSRFALQGVADPDILRFYEDMAEKMGLMRHIFELAREYILMGEAFPFLIWDYEMNAWGDAIVLNPDYVEVHGVMMGGTDKGLRYEMVIDHELRQFIMSPDPLDQEIIAELDPSILQAAQSGLNAPLDKFNLTHLARRASPYDVRGTSILLGCLKDLLYDEQLREAMYVVAGGVIRPREIWKLGDAQNMWVPSDQDLDDFRALIASFRGDPNAALVTHYGVTVENVDAQRRLLPLKQEWDEIDRRLLTRLFTNKAATTGEGPTYANASVGMTILDARYAAMRDWIIEHIRQKVFLPVALANKFFDKDGHPVIPEFRWLSRVNLKDKNQQLSYLMTLHEAGRMPFHTVCDIFDLDYEETVSWIVRERGSIVDPAVTTAYKAQVQQRVTEEAQKRSMEEMGVDPNDPEGAALMAGVSEDVEESFDEAGDGIRDTQVKERDSSGAGTDTKPPKDASAPIKANRKGFIQNPHVEVRKDRRAESNGNHALYLNRNGGQPRNGPGFKNGNHDALRRARVIDVR